MNICDWPVQRAEMVMNTHDWRLQRAEGSENVRSARTIIRIGWFLIDYCCGFAMIETKPRRVWARWALDEPSHAKYLGVPFLKANLEWLKRPACS